MTTRDRLARLLNKCIPDINGELVVWRADALYPCRGFWRIRRVQMDVMSWTATAYRASKPTVSAWNGGCWETMTECLKAGAVHIYGRHMDTIAPGPYDDTKGTS